MQDIELIPLEELEMAVGGSFPWGKVVRDLGVGLLINGIYDGVKSLYDNRNNYNGAEIIYPALGT